MRNIVFTLLAFIGGINFAQAQSQNHDDLQHESDSVTTLIPHSHSDKSEENEIALSVIQHGSFRLSYDTKISKRFRAFGSVNSGNADAGSTFIVGPSFKISKFIFFRPGIGFTMRESNSFLISCKTEIKTKKISFSNLVEAGDGKTKLRYLYSDLNFMFSKKFGVSLEGSTYSHLNSHGGFQQYIMEAGPLLVYKLKPFSVSTGIIRTKEWLEHLTDIKDKSLSSRLMLKLSREF